MIQTEGQAISSWVNVRYGGVPTQELTVKIDAAIAEAVAERTRKCANVATSIARHFCGATDLAELHRAILALDQPPPKAWCIHTGKNPATGKWCLQESRHIGLSAYEQIYTEIPEYWTHCPICGKPRPTDA